MGVLNETHRSCSCTTYMHYHSCPHTIADALQKRIIKEISSNMSKAPIRQVQKRRKKSKKKSKSRARDREEDLEDESFSSDDEDPDDGDSD